MARLIVALLLALLVFDPAFAAVVKKGDCDGDGRVKRQKGCSAAMFAPSGTDFTEDANCIGAWLLFSNNSEVGAEQDRCGLPETDDLIYVGASFSVGASEPAGTNFFQDSVALNGTNQLFIGSSISRFEADTFTLGCWAYPDDTSNATIMSKGVFENWEIIWNNTLTWVSAWVKNVPETAAAGTVPVETWSHIMQRYDPATDQVELFINGVDACNGGCAAQTNAPSGNADFLRIGANTDGVNLFEGQLMECSYFNRALTNTEIAEIFLCGLNGNALGIARDAAFGGATCSAIDTCC